MAPVLTGGARLLPSFAVYESNSPPCGAGSPEGSPLRSSTPGLAIRAKVKTSAWRCQGQRRCLRAPCNTPVTLWQACYPGNSQGSLHRPTLVFSAHFVLTRAHPGTTSQSVTHPQIAPGQARLTWSSFETCFQKRRYTLLI
jgi:hypothetical protein